MDPLLCIVLCTLLCIVEIATHLITRDSDIYCLSFDLWYCYRRNSILASFDLFHSNERVASVSSTFTSSCSHFGGTILNASPTWPYETSPKRTVGLNFMMSMIPLSVSTSCARGCIWRAQWWACSCTHLWLGDWYYICTAVGRWCS